MAAHVTLWTADLDCVDTSEDLLSPDERERADARVSPVDARRFAASRVLLRNVLDRAAGVAPRHLGFDSGPHGKPALRGTDVRFSLSHSGDLALVAVARGVEVGVDVERRRAVPESLALARRWFTSAEADQGADEVVHTGEMKLRVIPIEEGMVSLTSTPAGGCQ